MKFDFTPGKWKAEIHKLTVYSNFVNCNGLEIARVNSMKSRYSKITKKEANANAKLIAYAPELLYLNIKLLREIINCKEELDKLSDYYSSVKTTEEIKKQYENEIKIVENATEKKWEEIIKE